MTLEQKIDALATEIGEDIAELETTVRETTSSDTSTNADLGKNIVLLDTHTPTLHEVTDATKNGKTISYFSDGATELTFQAGGTTMKGKPKINQDEAVTATLTEVGAGTATVWRLTGGSA
jgi:hypothetical protein